MKTRFGPWASAAFLLFFSAYSAAVSPSYTSAKQDRFIIGAWGKMPLSGPIGGSTANDLQALQRMRAAHFNTFATGWCGASEFNDPSGGAAWPSLHYALNLIAQIPGLRVMLWDSRYTGTYPGNAGVPGVVQSVKADVSSLSAPDVVMGYCITDEPSPGTALSNALTWISTFNTSDPSRIAWANLLPFLYSPRYNYFPNGWSDYCGYVRTYLDQSKSSVAGFDYYAFNNGDIWNSYNDPYASSPTFYFRNLDLFAAECNSRGMSFWAFPYSGHETDPNLNKAPISEENLRFQAFAPLVYGAKGIVYYTYTLHPGMDMSMVDAAGNNPTVVYTWASDINAQVKSMGPVLMGLDRIATYHENQIDNGGYPGQSLETGLATVAPDNAVIGSFSSTFKSFVLGHFIHGTTPYLLVFNKDRFSSRDVTITLKKAVPVWQMNKATGTWNRLYASTTTVNLTNVGKSDIQLLRLANLDTSPIINLLLND
jgi:hypothetical protein